MFFVLFIFVLCHVPNVASVSGWSILDRPFSFLQHLFIFIGSKLQCIKIKYFYKLSFVFAENNVIICIDDDNTLLCDKEHNTVISITRASYGRNSIRKCPEGNIGTTSCGPKNILQMVKQQCNGKHLCRVTEPDEDPCPGTTKYFKISYDCVKGS